MVMELYPYRSFTRRQLAHRLSAIEEAETQGANLEEFVERPHVLIHGALLLSALGELQSEGLIRVFHSNGELGYRANRDQK
jgi:hypothetical protein